MAKVTYLGPLGALTHHGNPSGTDYVFQKGNPTEISNLEDAQHYADEIKRGGPWKVDMGIIEKAAELIKKPRRGGKE